jgi:predicted nicotinamide N-methyase
VLQPCTYRQHAQLRNRSADTCPAVFTLSAVPTPLLATGMGLVGLLCAQLGAASVLLTDYEPAVLAHLSQNAALNGLQQRCASQQLDWRRPQDSLRPEHRGSWRLVLAADVLYASVVVQPFIDTLALLLHAEGERALGFGSAGPIVLPAG